MSDAQDLVDLETCKLWLDLQSGEDDVLLESEITVASKIIRDLCGRKLVDDDVSETETTEARGKNTSVLVLPTRPIQELTSIHESTSFLFDSTTLVDSDDYFLIESRGLVRLKSGTWSDAKDSIQVIYKGGYSSDSIPVTLQKACAYQVAWNLLRMELNGAIRGRLGPLEIHFSAKSLERGYPFEVDPLIAKELQWVELGD